MLDCIIEAIIFASEQPIKQEEIIEILQKSPEHATQWEAQWLESLPDILIQLTQKYQADIYPFEIRKVANGFQFYTKTPYFFFVKQLVISKHQKKLSKAAIETLSIIAYKQPLTKPEIEHIRGVSSDYAVQKLLDKKLITIAGRANAPGKPLLYTTTSAFLQYLGINHLDDLPKLKEFETTGEEQIETFLQQN